MIAETEKLQAETRKFVSEQLKLGAEAAKLNRERALAPWQIAVVTAGGIAGLIAAFITALKSLGVM